MDLEFWPNIQTKTAVALQFVLKQDKVNQQQWLSDLGKICDKFKKRDHSNDIIFQELNISDLIEEKLPIVAQHSFEKGFKIPALLLILDSAVNVFNIPSSAWTHLMTVRNDYSTVSPNDFHGISIVHAEVQLLQQHTGWVKNILIILQDLWRTQKYDIPPRGITSEREWNEVLNRLFQEITKVHPRLEYQSNNYIMRGTKKQKNNSSKFRGLMPDGIMTFYTISGISVVLLVMECGSPLETTLIKKDQDKRKVLIEALFCRTQLIHDLMFTYENLISEQVAERILKLETLWVQAYGTRIRAGLFDQQHLPLSISKLAMDVSLPRPLMEAHGRREIKQDNLSSFLAGFAQLQQAINRFCNELDDIDRTLMALQPRLGNQFIPTTFSKNLIMTDRDFLLNKNDL